MRKELAKQLDLLTDEEFFELQHCVGFASSVRNIKRVYNLTDEEMAQRLRVPPEGFKTLLSGSYPYDVMMMARLEAYGNELAVERKRKTES